MVQARIVLEGISPKLKGLRWETRNGFRIGRHDGSDIVLQDVSVFRQHAEIIRLRDDWIIRDLANHERHPTMVNGKKVSRTEHKLRGEDIVQVGTLLLKVLADVEHR